MNSRAKLLLVDDNQSVLDSLKFFLDDKFSSVTCLNDPHTIPDYIRQEGVDVVVLDMNFSTGVSTGEEGLHWISEIRKFDDSIQIIALTAYGSIELAIEAVKLGANDFLVKPWDNAKLLSTIEKALKLKTRVANQEIVKNRPGDQGRLHEPRSKKMQYLNDQISKISGTDVNVLILGETGSGKEVIARQIHDNSARSKMPFIGVDLGAINETIFESELFGHKKGAFTDAREDRKGRVLAASGGTLFLDEIGNIPLSLQVKLLTLIQNRSFLPIGSDKSISVDVRLICATNMNLENMIRNSDFREDLYYRINTIQLTIPPLRERPEDIPGFAKFFLEYYQEKYHKTKLKLSEEAISIMVNYPWPGNIRELKHAIERAVILSNSQEQITGELLIKEHLSPASISQSPTLHDAEKEIIRNALKNNSGNISKAAKELNITRQTLYAKINKYGL